MVHFDFLVMFNEEGDTHVPRNPPFDFCSLLCNPAGREASERSGGYKSALDGLIVRRMIIQNAGGECIRLRGECAQNMNIYARWY